MARGEAGTDFLKARLGWQKGVISTGLGTVTAVGAGVIGFLQKPASLDDTELDTIEAACPGADPHEIYRCWELDSDRLIWIVVLFSVFAVGHFLLSRMYFF